MLTKQMAEMFGSMIGKMIPKDIADQLTLENFEEFKAKGIDALDDLKNTAQLIRDDQAMIKNQLALLLNERQINVSGDNGNIGTDNTTGSSGGNESSRIGKRTATRSIQS